MNDFLIVSKEFLKDLKKFKQGFPVLFVAVSIYLLILSLFNNLTRMGTNVFFGFFRWMIYLSILTHFASLMRLLFSMEKLDFSDLTTYDSSLLGPLSQVSFFFWMIDLVLSLLPYPLRLSPAYLLLYSLWKLYRAPAYEAVYIGENTMAQVFSTINQLWKDSPLSMAIYFLIVFLAQKEIVQSISTRAQYFELASLGNLFLEALFFTFYYYTKGIFCRILLSSNKRGRAFRERIQNGR